MPLVLARTEDFFRKVRTLPKITLITLTLSSIKIPELLFVNTCKAVQVKSSPERFIQKVYEKLKSKGVTCIGDEVQTGFGRIGEAFWAFEYYGVTLTLSR